MNIDLNILKAKARYLRAFSLVEVMIALAVMSTSFLVIVGLAGTGLKSFVSAKNIGVSSQIAQQIIIQLQSTTFSALTNNQTTSFHLSPPGGTGFVWYFDYQGESLQSTSGTPPANAVYQANVCITPNTSFLGATTISNSALATISIQVIYNPSNLTPDSSNNTWTGTANGGKIFLRMYSCQTCVARNS